MSGIALFVGFLLGLGTGLCLAAFIAMRDPTTRSPAKTDPGPPPIPPLPPPTKVTVRAIAKLTAPERHRYRN